MLRTKILAVSGLLLTLSSVLFGARFWGYQQAVLLMQTGGLALALGLFFRLVRSHDRGAGQKPEPLAGLYNMESFP